jgi:hypothetical protein
MRESLIILVLLLFVLGSDARIPQIGDYVSISNFRGEIYWGNVTTFENGTICINCTAKMGATGAMYIYDNSISENPFLPKGTRNAPHDVCMGAASIESIHWMNP